MDSDTWKPGPGTTHHAMVRIRPRWSDDLHVINYADTVGFAMYLSTTICEHRSNSLRVDSASSRTAVIESSCGGKAGLGIMFESQLEVLCGVIALSAEMYAYRSDKWKICRSTGPPWS